ncbi:MAG: Phosphoglycerate kinase [Parcubacteria group bacterium GW2011_GWA2_43_9b]|nr:MAG: Phosphoglycerate kinase [Parcubacteria group bacterium GW2011_GWA2_43_9b]
MRLLKDADIKNKRVLVRADFNVALDASGRVLDDFRLRATLPTIQYLKEQGAEIILMAHLGRPQDTDKSEAISDKFSLRPIAEKLSELLGQEVRLAPDCVGKETALMADQMKPGEILLLENLRWHGEEEKNDIEFAGQLALLGDIYVNDAFGVSHRAHASVAAITGCLPSCVGFLLAKEVVNLTRVRDNPDHPLVAVIGGAKISTKIKLIQSFLNKAEDVILGGALANTMLHAKGIAIGRSFVETEILPELKNLELTNTKIHLPVDAVLCENKEGTGAFRVGAVGSTGEQELILDIGPDSQKLFASIIARAKMVVWNGPMGLFETKSFDGGTIAVAQAVINSGAYSIVGGGETVAFLAKLGFIDKFSFVSTGGGAMMEFLSGEDLPGIVALEK